MQTELIQIIIQVIGLKTYLYYNDKGSLYVDLLFDWLVR